MKPVKDSDNVRKKTSYTLFALSLMMLVACGTTVSGDVSSTVKKKDTGLIVTGAGMYDSADTDALLVARDPEGKTVTFYNKSVGKNYTLNYDGTSKIYDKYGTAMSMEQMQTGSIVDITFLKGKRLLNSMQESKNAWKITGVKEFNINELDGMVSASGNTYRFDDNIAVYEDGKKAMLMDINQVDTITVSGVDRMAYSISIDEGHGYLKLKNEEYFVGGWIEVGSKIIKTIGEDMIIAVPVGTYEVNLSNNGVEGVKTVNIDRNEETELDIGDLKTEELITFGNLYFVLNPSVAEVYIDGEAVDATKPVPVEYGIHQLMVKSPGYQTLTQYIKVGQENATLEINLEAETEPVAIPTPTAGVTPVAPSPSPIPTYAPSTEVISTTIGGYKITVGTPTGAEVYLDGNYIGISPVSFTKVSGKHEIILRCEGYVTRSFTLSIDTKQQDEVFSFPDLELTAERKALITPTPSPTAIPTAIPTVTPTAEPAVTAEVSPSVSPEAVPSVTPEMTPTPQATPSPETTPEITPASDANENESPAVTPNGGETNGQSVDTTPTPGVSPENSEQAQTP